MNEPNDQDRDELRDRLLDQALRETLGAESPPDLTDRILAAAMEQVSELPQPKGEGVMEKRRRRSWIWATVAVVACLLIAVGITLVTQAARGTRSTRQLAIQMGSHKYHDGYQVFPSPNVLQNDAQSSDSGDSLVYIADSKASTASPSYTVGKPVWETRTKEKLVESAHRRLMVGSGEQSNRSAGPGTPPPVNLPLMPGVSGPEPTRFEFSAGVTSDAGLTGNVVVRESDFDFQRNAGGVRMVAPRIVIQEEEESRLGTGRKDQGGGPGQGGDQYDRIVENPFQAVKDHPLSTLSIDVDTASYANVRRFLLRENQLPPPDAVRIEELVNYFDYDYSGPTSDVPFASHIEVAGCPWAPEHRLVRIALKGYEIQTNQRPASNLVFLLDVSGSMAQPDKLPLLQAGMKLLAGQLSENDRVAIVVYAGSEGLVLPSTVGDQRATILDAIDRLSAGGSTNGGAGIELAYKIAQEHFVKGGVNRVVLCTDGDFNVGTTSTGALERMVVEKARSGVFLSVLGFGRGNLNDAMMETIADKGNGNYAYIDGITEAQKVLVEQMGGTLITIAKDVKIQVEFNPAQVEGYRLIGYENRVLAAEDFNDDKKDAGEIGAGHTVTALYELVPAGGKVDISDVDPLKYQSEPKKSKDKAVAGELLTLKLRYKEPDGQTSELLEFPVTDSDASFSKASSDFQFAAAVASFGMLLRGSEHCGLSSYDAVLEIAESAKGPDKYGYRAEFVEMVGRAKTVAGK